MIDAPTAHLLLNHFPIVLGLLGAVAALLALFMRRRTVWMFAVALITIGALFAQPAVMTGRRAATVMERTWYVSREAVQEHELGAEWARWAMLLAGVVSLFAWWHLVRAPRTTKQQRDGRPGDFPTWLQWLVLLTAMLSASATTRAALLGGRIVHGAAALVAPRTATAPDSTPAVAPPAIAPSVAPPESLTTMDSLGRVQAPR